MLTINREICEDLLCEKMNKEIMENMKNGETCELFMTDRLLKKMLRPVSMEEELKILKTYREEMGKIQKEFDVIEDIVDVLPFIQELKEEINHKNNKFSEWIVENKELAEENEKLKEENEKLNKARDDITRVTRLTDEENEELKEEAVENKKLFDTTFGEMMKLKEYKDHSEKCWGDLSEEIDGERDAMRWAEVENRIKEQDEENEYLNAELNDRVVIEDIAHLFGRGDEGNDFDWESEIGGLVKDNKELKEEIEELKKLRE